jgi:thiamine pyrophosphokinase
MPAEELEKQGLLSPPGEEVFLRILIFAAGASNTKENPIDNHQPGDMVIAANGGTRYCLSLGIHPDVVIGDFDSITEDDFRLISGSETQIIKFPSSKDFTDLELALQHACSLEATEILIFGGLGLRWDQTLANILLLASPSLACSNIRLVDGNQEIFLISNASPGQILGKPGDTVSLIPIHGNASGITTSNLEYPLHNETLVFGASRGVSNVMTMQSATVTLTDGLLICVVIHQ